MELIFLFFHCLAVVALLVHGQDQSDFISIDCGMAEDGYMDDTTNIKYISDVNFINTGEKHNISQEFNSPYVAYLSQASYSPNVTNLPMRQLSSVRSFPNATITRNCYTFNPPGAKGNNYLIRAWFMYGNYDSNDQTPEFELYLEVDKWETVNFSNAAEEVYKEIIHVPRTDYIHVCLVNTGRGTPFISALEITKLNNSIYQTQNGWSLATYRRLDLGSAGNQIVRYEDDVYDRIWRPLIWPCWKPLRIPYTWGHKNSSFYKLPPSVMATAVTPICGQELTFNFTFDPGQKVYLYMHCAEVEKIQPRKLKIYLNGGRFWTGDCSFPSEPKTFYTSEYVSVPGFLELSIHAAENFTLPILNALELYLVKEFSQFPTNQTDVDSIRKIKSVYKIERNWQGDPCLPSIYIWHGLNCSNDLNFPKITYLHLPSTGLVGNVDRSLARLESLFYINFSNNGLSGPFPDFLSQLPSLKYLDLSHNNLTGLVPSVLIERSKTGSLTLITDGNPNLWSTAACKTKKKKSVITRFKPLIVSLASFIILLTATLAILWNLRRRKLKRQVQEPVVKPNVEAELLESKNRHFTYLEVTSITSDFKEVLGVGGFGRVYRGCLNDGTQVAVKMLSHPSILGSKQFRTEAQLLTKVHHKNLVSLIGYCHEGEHMGVIYEYMANGNLQRYLSEQNPTLLTWEQRVQIAIDAAQALDYLHNGCKPPVVHRDIKATNILLTENLQAKVSDFGISRFMPLMGETQVSTALAGTPGYLDPLYQITNRLNEKSDVYSFGIVLLELITGQPPIIKIGNKITYIVEWIQPAFERAEIDKIVDSRLRGEYDNNSAWKVLDTAMSCVSRSPSQRPSMSLVVAELKECVDHARTMQERDSSIEIMAADLGSLAATGPSTR